MNLLNELDSFKNNQKIISYNQSTNDIINAILRQHNKSLNDYDKLYYFFDGGNVCNTARKVFNYLKDYFINHRLDNEKYTFLVCLASEKQLKSLSANLLYTGDFSNRIQRALYETYALN